jgi:protocatechuate 3,4-dioxygenase beta subunit
MKRSEFIRRTGAAMLAFTLPVQRHYAFAADEQVTDVCIPTTTDILGPYYRANAPFRSDLVAPGDPGTIFHYSGAVIDSNCNPVPNAIVDVWQANADAEYDNSSADFAYRGKYQTGADGKYRFRAVKPGWYLNGAQYRPAHIHFRVTCPGYTELITQLYFEGDPYIAADPWASDPSAQQRIVPIGIINGEEEALFDIVLQGSGTHIQEQQQRSPITLFPNPMVDTLHIASGVAITGIELTAANGQLVYADYKVNSAPFELRIPFLGAGIYFCRIATVKGIFVHKILKQ